MKVEIVQFPETRVAVAEHRGPPAQEYETSRKLIAWRKANGVSVDHHKTFGVHHTDPYSTAPEDHRVDFCVSYDRDIEDNPQNIVAKVIPANRCAVARHLGSRAHNAAAVYLFRECPPVSGFIPGDLPVFLPYVNVGPDVREADMITDVYLPIRESQ